MERPAVNTALLNFLKTSPEGQGEPQQDRQPQAYSRVRPPNACEASRCQVDRRMPTGGLKGRVFCSEAAHEFLSVSYLYLSAATALEQSGPAEDAGG